MAVVRTYQCNDCGVTFKHWHDSGDEPEPECPACALAAAEAPAPKKRGRPKGSKTGAKKNGVAWVPEKFAMTGNRSRAMDLAQKIAEEDYGMTNMRDNLRVGDVAGMTPVASTAEREREEKARAEVAQYAASNGIPLVNNLIDRPEIRAQTNAFFGGGMSGVGPAGPAMTAQAAIAANPSGVSRAQGGASPMQLLHQAGKSGKLPIKAGIMGKA